MAPNNPTLEPANGRSVSVGAAHSSSTSVEGDAIGPPHGVALAYQPTGDAYSFAFIQSLAARTTSGPISKCPPGSQMMSFSPGSAS